MIRIGMADVGLLEMEFIRLRYFVRLKAKVCFRV